VCSLFSRTGLHLDLDLQKGRGKEVPLKEEGEGERVSAGKKKGGVGSYSVKKEKKRALLK